MPNLDALATALGTNVDQLIELEPEICGSYFIEEDDANHLIETYVLHFMREAQSPLVASILPGYDAAETRRLQPDSPLRTIFVAYGRVFELVAIFPMRWRARGPVTAYGLERAS